MDTLKDRLVCRLILQQKATQSNANGHLAKHYMLRLAGLLVCGQKRSRCVATCPHITSKLVLWFCG